MIFFFYLRAYSRNEIAILQKVHTPGAQKMFYFGVNKNLFSFLSSSPYFVLDSERSDGCIDFTMVSMQHEFLDKIDFLILL